jgi:hypothetical protein
MESMLSQPTENKEVAMPCDLCRYFDSYSEMDKHLPQASHWFDFGWCQKKHRTVHKSDKCGEIAATKEEKEKRFGLIACYQI